MAAKPLNIGSHSAGSELAIQFVLASTGSSPFRKSKTNTTIPYGFPTTRKTLVAPIFPEPCFRISIPFSLATSKPKGIDPARKPAKGRRKDKEESTLN